MNKPEKKPFFSSLGVDAAAAAGAAAGAAAEKTTNIQMFFFNAIFCYENARGLSIVVKIRR